MSRLGRISVELRNIAANRSPGETRAIILDPKHLGLSAFANGEGELFFTMPYNHPAVVEADPLQRHYRVRRYNPRTGNDDIIATGLIYDYTADGKEVVVYGHDYMGLLSTTITASNTSYTNATLGSIVSDQLSSAINEGFSRLGFMSMGSIEATSETATLLTSFEPRLQFLANVAEISMADRSVRTILTVGRSSPWAFTFNENKGVDRPDLRLEYGGAFNAFDYQPGFGNFATRAFGVGIKREGASILYSTQTYGDESVYGRIARAFVHQDVVNQKALDDLVKRDARQAGTAEKNLRFVLRHNHLGPYEGYEFGDSVRGIVTRGERVSVNGLYTVWGHLFTVNPDSGQTLSLVVEPKGL